MDWTGEPPYYEGEISLDALAVGCSECGYPWKKTTGNLPNYCENCGAKVEQWNTRLEKQERK